MVHAHLLRRLFLYNDSVVNVLCDCITIDNKYRLRVFIIYGITIDVTVYLLSMVLLRLVSC